MESTLSLQGCVEDLEENKLASMYDATSELLNCKANTHIYMVVSSDVLVNIKELTSGHEVWKKLKSTTAMDKVHLMEGLRMI